MGELPLLFDRYKVVRKLGSGAFATVYLADDLRMGRPVAIKVVPQSADVDDRVLREAQAAAKLNHHNIVTVYEMVREPERTLLFTEYIEGRTLRRHFQDQDLSDHDILDVGIQLCRALDHAHKRGVVHRDIKPENIMLVGNEAVDVRLMDFGVAQLEDRASITTDGDIIGTLAYMSPEALEAKTVDSRSDIFSLALTVYEGLARRNPHKGKRVQELMRDVSRPDIPPLSFIRPELPPLLVDALERALAYDRYSRPDAADFGRLLSQSAGYLPEEEVEGGLARRLTTRLTIGYQGRDRLEYFGRHVASGVFALLSLVYVLPRVPFYPGSWLIPLMVAPALVALLWPFGGGLLTLALLAPPIFAFSPGWGVVYIIGAAIVMGMMRWRRREWTALLPGAIPIVAGIGLGLAIPPLAGAIARRWGALLGFASGLVLSIAAGFAGWSLLPYTFGAGVGTPLLATRHVRSPWEALNGLAHLLDSRPELSLQVALFAIFALPFYRLVGGTGERRLWGAALYLTCFYAGFTLLPLLALHVPISLGLLLVAFAPCAIIAFLSALLIPSEGPLSL
jgi:eukaryotic-like serine/threonine-protein kinase